MQEILRKIKRVHPIIKMRKNKVDEESLALVQIRNEKIAKVAAMKENQRRYMQGVDDLNRIRQSNARENLDTMEQSLDYLKLQWYKLYKNVQDLEQKEKNKIAVLLAAERDLKSIEKLKEKYELELKSHINKAEQRQMDEHALRSFTSSKSYS